MISLILAAATFAPDSEQLSFRADGERLDVVVERLSEATGLELQAGTEGRSHYLVIRVENSSAEQIMDGIAAATGSKWEESGFGLRLNPDRELRQELMAAEEAKLEDSIERAMVKWAADLEQAKETAPEQSFYWTSSISPVFSLDMVAQLLPLIDSRELARSRRSERVVFSTRPTPMQSRFVDAPTTLLADLRRTYAEYLDWYFDDEDRSTQAARNAYQIEQSRYSRFFVWPSHGVPLDKVNLAISWFRDLGSSPSITVELQGYNMSDGRPLQVFEHRFYLSPLTNDDEASDIAALIDRISELQYGEEVGEILEFRPVASHAEFSDMPEAYRQLILNPERFDPQELFAPVLVDSLFGHLEGDVIACLPDSVVWLHLSPFYRDQLASLSVSSIERSCRYESVAEIHVIGPRDPALVAACAVDRQVLGRFVRGYVGYVSLPVRVLADFLDSVGNSMGDYCGVLSVRAVLGQPAFSNLLPAELLSHCDPSQADLILNGVEGRLNNLSQGFRQRLSEMVFSGQWGLILQEPAAALEYVDLFATQVSSSNHPVERRRLEPTELLPNGIPGASQIRTSSFEGVGIAAYPDETSRMQGVTISSEYMYVYSQVTRAQSPSGTHGSGFSMYRFAPMTTTDIVIQFTDDLVMRFLVEDTTITLDSPAYTDADFPERYTTRIEQARSALAASERLGFLFDQRFGAPPIRP